MRWKTILALAAIWGIPDGWLIVGLVFIGFAVFLLCLAIYLHNYQPGFVSKIDDLASRWGKTLAPYFCILFGFGMLYLAGLEIRQYLHIREDPVRTMGAVTKIVEDDDNEEGPTYRIHLVFTDEQGVEHRLVAESRYEPGRRRLPVIYHRPDPDLAMVDDFWITIYPCGHMLFLGTSFLLFGTLMLVGRMRSNDSLIFRGGKAVLVRLLQDRSGGETYYDDQDQDVSGPAEDPSVEEITEMPTVQSLITDLSNADPMVREYAAQELGQTGDKQAIKPLASALEDEEQAVRAAARRSLIQALIRTLDDRNPRARVAAARALGQIGGKQAIEVLAKALKDEDKTVRTAARESLTIIQNKLGPEE